MRLESVLSLLAVTLVVSSKPTQTSFLLQGASPHWEVKALFTPAEFESVSDKGYEFGPHLTSRSRIEQAKWIRIEPIMPEPLTIRSRPGPALPRGTCIVDWEIGQSIERGHTFTFGVCEVYPWAQSGTQLKELIQKGVYVVAWEDASGVHVEGVSLATEGNVKEF